MVVEITRMSKNGQVVIPSEIRKIANITPKTQFLVLSEKGNIILKRIEEVEIIKDIELIKKIERSEAQIKKGDVVTADTDMSIEEVDKLLMS